MGLTGIREGKNDGQYIEYMLGERERQKLSSHCAYAQKSKRKQCYPPREMQNSLKYGLNTVIAFGSNLSR